jgi:hypothetical protein
MKMPAGAFVSGGKHAAFLLAATHFARPAGSRRRLRLRHKPQRFFDTSAIVPKSLWWSEAKSIIFVADAA